MTNTWQLQEAKSRFSELVDKAISDGPQVVTKRGKDAVVVLSADEFKKLNKSSDNLISFFKHSPKFELDISRSKESDRKVNLI